MAAAYCDVMFFVHVTELITDLYTPDDSLLPKLCKDNQRMISDCDVTSHKIDLQMLFNVERS